MEDVNYDELFKIIDETTKRSFLAYENNGKIEPNVANLGAKIGDVAKLERFGEYYGIGVEFMEDVKPLLTNKFVFRILNFLKKQDYITALGILGLSGIDQIRYILHKWFTIATTGYQNQLLVSGQNQVSTSDQNQLSTSDQNQLSTSDQNQLSASDQNSDNLKNYPMFDYWIESVAHDPLPSKIKVVDIGQNQNTGASVLPPEWIGRVFKNGTQLHQEMSNLETRIGKPPVTYAVIYSMIIQKNETFVENIDNIKFNQIFLFRFD